MRGRTADAGTNVPDDGPSALVDDVLGWLEGAGVPMEVCDRVVAVIEEHEKRLGRPTPPASMTLIEWYAGHADYQSEPVPSHLLLALRFALASLDSHEDHGEKARGILAAALAEIEQPVP